MGLIRSVLLHRRNMKGGNGSASAALRSGARSAGAHSGLSYEWLIGLGSRRIVIIDLIWSALVWRSNDPVFFHPGDQGSALHSQP